MFSLLALSGCYLAHRAPPAPADAEPDSGVSLSPPDAGLPDTGTPDAEPPVPDAGCREELCNGADDDCDGAVDEGVCTTRAAHVAIGSGTTGEYVCASTHEGRVACWGGRGLVRGDANAAGRVQALPRIVDGVEGALDVGVGGYVSCALTGDGVTCWGEAATGTRATTPSPPIVIAEMAGASSLSVAASNYCAVVGREVICSANTPGPDPRPTTFWTVDGARPARVVSGSSWNTFVIQRAGSLVGWGLDYEGELGIGSTMGIVERPVEVEGLADVTDVCTGGRHSCAIHDGGRVSCWGVLLGDGTEDTSDVPVETALEGAVQLSCGSGHTCAVLEDGSAWCWGRNHYGQLGDGTRDHASSPVRVALDDVTEVAAGGGTTCAVTSDGAAWCWGNNCHGAVGDGTTDGMVISDGTCTRLRPRPTRVLLP